MKITNYLFFLLTLTVFFIACDKDNDTSPLVGRWEVTSVQMRTVANPTWRSSTNTPCSNNSVHEFRSNGRYVITSSCGETLGNWRVNNSNTLITLTYDAFSGSYFTDIISINRTSMTTEHEAEDLAGTRYRYTYRKL